MRSQSSGDLVPSGTSKANHNGANLAYARVPYVLEQVAFAGPSDTEHRRPILAIGRAAPQSRCDRVVPESIALALSRPSGNHAAE